MGNSITIPKLNFEDIQSVLNIVNNNNNNNNNTLINIKKRILMINTIDPLTQDCVISGTLDIRTEIETLNAYLNKNKDVTIIIYGMNSSDNSVIKKYQQLIKLGFYNVHVYIGGLFEWLLLQDIYGYESFPTTNKKPDILKFKGSSFFADNII